MTWSLFSESRRHSQACVFDGHERALPRGGAPAWLGVHGRGLAHQRQEGRARFVEYHYLLYFVEYHYPTSDKRASALGRDVSCL